MSSIPETAGSHSPDTDSTCGKRFLVTRERFRLSIRRSLISLATRLISDLGAHHQGSVLPGWRQFVQQHNELSVCGRPRPDEIYRR